MKKVIHDQSSPLPVFYNNTMSSRCSQGESGLVCLYVHSNSNYTFRVKPLPAGENEPAEYHVSNNGAKVQRNTEKNGVEIWFQGKPDAATIQKCKDAKFKPSKFGGWHWYKTFSPEAWAQAHDIAGLPLATSGATVAQAQKSVDHFDMAVEDRMSEQCGLTGTHD